MTQKGSRNAKSSDNNGYIVTGDGNIFYPPRPKSPPPFQVPDLPVHCVLGDQTVLDIVHQLAEETELATKMAIFGSGGIGKSTLAIAIGRHQKTREQFPDGILWGALGRHSDVINVQAAWLDAFDVDPSRLNTPEARAAKMRTLLSGKRCLIIIDDVWQTSDLTNLFVGGDRCATLVTTRREDVAKQCNLSYQLGPLTLEDSVKLLLKWSERDTSESLPQDEYDTLEKLAERLGNLPLALKVVGSQFKYPHSRSILLEELNNKTANIQDYDSRSGNDPRESLIISFHESIDFFRNDSRNEHLSRDFALLSVFAAGREAPFGVDAVSALWQTDKKYTRREMDFLSEHGLVEKHDKTNSGGQYHLHAVISDYAHYLLKTKHATDIPGARQRHLQYYFDEVLRHSGVNWKEAERALPQLQLAHSRIAVDDTKRRLAWPENGSSFLTRRGYWSIYVQWAEAALTTGELTGDQNIIAWAENWLGLREYDLGQDDKALYHFQKAKVIFEGINHHHGIATAQANYADVLDRQGNHEKARSLYESNLELQVNLYNWQGVASTYMRLGLSAQREGKLTNSLAHMRNSLQEWSKIADPGGEASTHYHMGDVLLALGRPKEAYESFVAALERFKTVGDRINEASASKQCGKAQYKLGDYVQATSHFNESLELWGSLDNLFETAIVTNDLGAIAFHQGNLEQAITLFTESLEIFLTINMEKNIAITSWNLGEVYAQKQQRGIARLYLQQAFSLFEKLEHVNDAAMVQQALIGLG